MNFAKVSSLHKKEKYALTGNYRTVSILSVVSKVLGKKNKKKGFHQLNNYLVEKKLFYLFIFIVLSISF